MLRSRLGVPPSSFNLKILFRHQEQNYLCTSQRRLATMAANTSERPRMKYRNLGSSGLKVSKVIVGCMSYGSSEWQDWVLDEEKYVIALSPEHIVTDHSSELCHS